MLDRIYLDVVQEGERCTGRQPGTLLDSLSALDMWVGGFVTFSELTLIQALTASAGSEALCNLISLLTCMTVVCCSTFSELDVSIFWIRELGFLSLSLRLKRFLSPARPTRAFVCNVAGLRYAWWISGVHRPSFALITSVHFSVACRKKLRSLASLSPDRLLVSTWSSQPSAKFSSVRSWWATSPLIAFILGHIYCSVRSTGLCVSLLLSVSLFAPLMVMTRAGGLPQVFERAGISGRWIPETQCRSSISCFWALVARACRWSRRDLIGERVQNRYRSEDTSVCQQGFHTIS